MRAHLSLALSLALSSALPAAFAAQACNTACLEHIHEGQALATKGLYKEAFDRFDAARAAAPQSSFPFSMAASLLEKLSRDAPQPQKLREQARAMAGRALELDPDDPMAQEALRNLENEGASVLRPMQPEAHEVLVQAEAAFSSRRYVEALALYQQAMPLDPLSSLPWVGAGDCHYARRRWREAEGLFRRATEIEPRNAQAWRFLSDALAQQDKRRDAEGALLSGIAAEPSQLPNWARLDQLRAGAGLPLKRLALYRGIKVVADGARKGFEVQVNEDVGKQAGTANGNFRMLLALAEVKLRSDASDQGKALAPFDIELGAWRSALQDAADAGKNPKERLADPALRQMLAFAKDGQLEPAILLLLYKESYRPALEAWLARDPGGVRTFVDRYGIRP
ncbi:hypothetical protein [Massilia suwonensis]|uniref:Tetratricopeptide repeat protein n=1 Tax=Massilia suwonensis TaxID=648895 RepID=A0ABW0MW12_9BURK